MPRDYYEPERRERKQYADYYRPDLDARNYTTFKEPRREDVRETYCEPDVQYSRSHKRKKAKKQKRSKERNQTPSGPSKALVAYDDISSDSELALSPEEPVRGKKPDGQRKTRHQSPNTALREYEKTRGDSHPSDRYKRSEEHRVHRSSPSEPAPKKARQHSPNHR